MILKRTADLLEQCYTMSGNPHHFALPTPPSDHENDSSKLDFLSKYFHKNLSIFFSLLHVVIRRYKRKREYAIACYVDDVRIRKFCMSILFII